MKWEPTRCPRRDAAVARDRQAQRSLRTRAAVTPDRHARYSIGLNSHVVHSQALSQLTTSAAGPSQVAVHGPAPQCTVVPVHVPETPHWISQGPLLGPTPEEVAALTRKLARKITRHVES